MKAELIFYNGAKLLEGPCWDGRKGRLYFVAIRQNTIFCLEPETGRVYSYSTEGAVGAAVAAAAVAAPVGKDAGPAQGHR